MGANSSQPANDVMRVMSALSIVFCTPVLASFAIFPELFKKSYHCVVFYIAICDLFTGIGGSLGTQTASEVGARCWIQYLLTNNFMMSSIFWCTAISFNLYNLTVRGVVQNKEWRLYEKIICWGIPMFITILPFSTENAGADDGYSSWCYLVNRSGRDDESLQIFWAVFSNFLWIWIGVFAMAAFLGLTFLKVHRTFSILNGKIEIAIKKLILYPIVSVIQWTPATVHAFMFETKTIYMFTMDAFILYRFLIFSGGVFTSLIFFSSNKNIRVAWFELLWRQQRVNVDGDVRASDTGNLKNNNDPLATDGISVNPISGNGVQPRDHSVPITITGESL